MRQRRNSRLRKFASRQPCRSPFISLPIKRRAGFRSRAAAPSG
ncbi:hypothetical protein RHECNPAF_1340046 [Rhizobium etli CNPAF512]|nr:hypothetical protein RHECNPAF_1340046 [Rhizobium etli CNPAF512]